MGYRMGKAYRMLPMWLIMKCTMNREYWLEKKKAVTEDDDNNASCGTIDEVSVITMTFMMRKIRQAKVQIEAAMFWVIMSLILVVFAVVREQRIFAQDF